MQHYASLALATSLLFFSSGMVQAESNREAPPQRPSFASLDGDEDGEISFDEFSSHEVPRGDHETIFNHIDADSDGIITEEEFENHKPPQRPKREGNR